MLLIGYRELIGNQNAIDTALLQRFEIALGGFHDLRYDSTRIIQRITWQRTQAKLKGLTPEEFRSQSLAVCMEWEG